MHCIDRAWDRYGIHLTAGDIRTMERALEAGRSVLVRNEPNGASVHIVMHGPLAMVAVWGDREGGGRQQIITFLPEDAVLKGNQQRRLLADHERHREHRGGRHRRAASRRAAWA